MKHVLLILSLPVFLAANEISYKNYKIFAVLLRKHWDVNILNALLYMNKAQPWSKHQLKLDNSYIGSTFSVMVSPKNVNFFLAKLHEQNIDCDVIFNDLEEIIIRTTGRDGREAQFGWTHYHTLEEIYNWIDSLPNQFSGNVKTIDAGRTYEGRNIRGVHISFRPNNPSIFIEAGIQASEWIGPATATYIINKLLEGAFLGILQSYDWYIFPVFNPDGYVHSFTKDRFWRRNRSKQPGNSIGVDLDRNWIYKKPSIINRNDSHSETYTRAISLTEVESESMSKYLLSIKDNLFAYISLNSMGQLLMFPYGNTRAYADDAIEMLDIANKAASALAQRHGTIYKVGPAVDRLGLIEGLTIDWAKGVLNLPLVYMYKMRCTTDNYGLLFPPEHIIPNSEEILDSLKAMFEEAKNSSN